MLSFWVQDLLFHESQLTLVIAISKMNLFLHEWVVFFASLFELMDHLLSVDGIILFFLLLELALYFLDHQNVLLLHILKMLFQISFLLFKVLCLLNSKRCAFIKRGFQFFHISLQSLNFLWLLNYFLFSELVILEFGVWARYLLL